MATTSLDEKLELIRQARNEIQTALQNKGQAVNTDIRTYAEAINNITGTGGIKLFETEEELNASTNNNEGDIAEVYRVERDYFTANSAPSNGFANLVVPDKIVLDEAYSGNEITLLSCNDNSSMMYVHVFLNPTTILFRVEGNKYATMTYNSTDGKTFIKEDTSTTVDDIFGTMSTASTDVTCDYVDITKKVVYQEVVTNKLYIFKDNAWVARDIGGTATANKVLKGYNIFKKNEIVEGTYVAPTRYNYYETIFGVKTANVGTSYGTGAGSATIGGDFSSYSLLKLRPDTEAPTNLVPFNYIVENSCLSEMTTGYLNGSLSPSCGELYFLPISQTISSNVGLCYSFICSEDYTLRGDRQIQYDTCRVSLPPYTEYTEYKLPKSITEFEYRRELFYLSDSLLVYPVPVRGTKNSDDTYNYTISVVFYNLTDGTFTTKDLTTIGNYTHCRVVNNYLIIMLKSGIHIYDLQGNKIISTDIGTNAADASSIYHTHNSAVLNKEKLYVFDVVNRYLNVRVIDCTGTPTISDYHNTNIPASVSDPNYYIMPRISFEDTVEIDIGYYKFNTETFECTSLFPNDSGVSPFEYSYTDQLEQACILYPDSTRDTKIYTNSGVNYSTTCYSFGYSAPTAPIALMNIDKGAMVIPSGNNENPYTLRVYQTCIITGINDNNKDTVTICPSKHEFLMSYSYSSDMMGPRDSYNVIGTPYFGLDVEDYGKNLSALSTEEYNTAIEIARDIKGNQ